MKEWQRHVIKQSHEDGQPIRPTYWCGADYIHGFSFMDAQHAALSVDQEDRLQPCPDCAKELMNIFAGAIT
jgi:hypothetical protein